VDSAGKACGEVLREVGGSGVAVFLGIEGGGGEGVEVFQPVVLVFRRGEEAAAENTEGECELGGPGCAFAIAVIGKGFAAPVNDRGGRLAERKQEKD